VIERSNFEERTLNRVNLRRLNQELDATRLKAEHLLPAEDLPVFSTNGSSSLPDGIRSLLRYLGKMAIQAKSSNHLSSRLKEPIARFVREHAFDQNMSLKTLAMQFNLSEVYVSRLFKELFSENFHTFVEEIRMSEAANLLAHSSLSIAQIAERVGYFSNSTFRRVFQRYYGTPPSKYQPVD
jgi:AraC-like DNA-binding protein